MLTRLLWKTIFRRSSTKPQFFAKNRTANKPFVVEISNICLNLVVKSADYGRYLLTNILAGQLKSFRCSKTYARGSHYQGHVRLQTTPRDGVPISTLQSTRSLCCVWTCSNSDTSLSTWPQQWCVKCELQLSKSVAFSLSKTQAAISQIIASNKHLNVT